jgi:quinol monooxygenase YgiN
MYGLIGKMNAHPGRREELLLSMRGAIGEMPGCLSYIIALDPDDADGLWITEVWTDEDSWKASLDLPHVQATITKAKPLIAGFSNRQVTTPVGGVGLGA